MRCVQECTILPTTPKSLSETICNGNVYFGGFIFMQIGPPTTHTHPLKLPFTRHHNIHSSSAGSLLLLLLLRTMLEFLFFSVVIPFFGDPFSDSPTRDLPERVQRMDLGLSVGGSLGGTGNCIVPNPYFCRLSATNSIR